MFSPLTKQDPRHTAVVNKLVLLAIINSII